MDNAYLNIPFDQQAQCGIGFCAFFIVVNGCLHHVFEN